MPDMGMRTAWLLLMILLNAVQGHDATSVPLPLSASTCPTALTINGVGKNYDNCLTYQDGSTLAFTFDANSSVFSAAFSAQPKQPYGWVAWGISPDGTMPKSSALIGWGGSVDQQHSLKTYYLPSYTEPREGGNLQVLDSAIEILNSGITIIFAFSLQLDPSETQVYTICSKGGFVNSTSGVIPPHILSDAATQFVNLTSGVSSGGGGEDETIRIRHGIIAAVSWGGLMPLGAFAARYMRPYADPLWFYTHWVTQLLAYLLGVATLGLGIKFGLEMTWREQHPVHTSLAIAISICASLQVIALAWRPDKKSNIRFYWNIFHHWVGYATVALGIANCLNGFTLLDKIGIWRTVYIVFLCVVGAAAAVMEVLIWMPWLRGTHENEQKGYREENGKLKDENA